MIKEFITGRWYRCIVKEARRHWVSRMTTILDGRPHLCIMGDGSDAEFDCVNGGSWTWGLDEFEEVMPDNFIDEWVEVNK